LVRAAPVWRTIAVKVQKKVLSAMSLTKISTLSTPIFAETKGHLWLMCLKGTEWTFAATQCFNQGSKFVGRKLHVGSARRNFPRAKNGLAHESVDSVACDTQFARI
jgi:hypothetical protein